MKILYDGRIFQMQRAGGINRYFAEVISGLPADFRPVVTGVYDFGINAPAHPRLVTAPFRFFRPGLVSQRLLARVSKPFLLAGVDVVHPTYYDLIRGYAYADFKRPVILTVHDFVHAAYPGLGDGSERLVREQSAAIRRADFIICISRFTEAALLQRFPEKTGRTRVIYHGSSFKTQPARAEEQLFAQPAFLFVGGRAGYKNFDFLLRVFAKASQADARIRLRVAGPPLTREERWQIHLLGVADQVESVVFPDEARLQELYRSSVALVYPSLHEGFGIPPLEAMACRTLAITSNATSLPEVVGDGGVLLDPTREADWVECLREAARGGGGRAAMIERGIKRAEMFSWGDTVAGHLKVYREHA